VPPQHIKEEIGEGTRPLNPWADAWPVGPKDAGHLLRPRVEDEIHIRLPEMPSTGYVWTLPEDLVAEHRNGGESGPAVQPYLQLIADTFTPTTAPSSGVIGAGGWRHLALRITRPGRFSLQLGKRRRWQRSAAPVEVFSVDLDASARRTGEYDRGLSEQQKALLSLAA
jgi:predicted secreted protein